MKIYVAASLSEDKREFMYEAVRRLRELGHTVYAPIEHIVEHAYRVGSSSIPQ